MWSKDTIPDAEPDGLPVQEVGDWGSEKYLRVWMYDEIFTNSMQGKWTRVYVDLFAGAGYARLKEAGRIVPNAALLALRVPHPFDLYVFCEKDPLRMEALRARVARLHPTAPVRFVEGDANRIAPAIIEQIPRDSLGFCFVDPYGTNIRLNTIRQLATERRLDFLILLALGMDANRNQALYSSEESERLDDFLGDHLWRERWEMARREGKRFQRFLAEEYATAMRSLGYLQTNLDDMHPVRDRGRLLYHLAFFSKAKLAQGFWREVRKYSDSQTSLEL